MSVYIEVESGLDESRLSERSRAVLVEILTASSNPRCRITSLARTPEDQARVMYENLVNPAVGVAHERALYLTPGNAVIDVFEEQQHLGADPATIQAAMAARIRAMGPSRISHHCCDPTELQVLDVATSSLARPNDFVTAAADHPRVSKVIDEPANHCKHVEIPQRSS